jgi:hypothetical protein
MPREVFAMKCGVWIAVRPGALRTPSRGPDRARALLRVNWSISDGNSSSFEAFIEAMVVEVEVYLETGEADEVTLNFDRAERV